jgi:hypothetical protein
MIVWGFAFWSNGKMNYGNFLKNIIEFYKSSLNFIVSIFLIK